MTLESAFTILAIEDDDLLRLTISECLPDRYTVIGAKNGREGIDLFHRHRPDLILLDLNLPEVHGFEVLETIRQESPDLMVIIMSGAHEMDNAIKALRLGAWDYLPKPFGMDTLRHSVNKAVERIFLLQANERYRQHLEEEVQQRTAEAEQRNAELEQILGTLQEEIKSHRRTAASLAEAKQVMEATLLHLEELVAQRTAELSKTVTTLQQEIEEHARTTATLRRREKELVCAAGELQDANAALRVLLQRRDREKEELTSGLQAHIHELVAPTLKTLRRSGLTEKQQHLLQRIELHLNEVLSPVCTVPDGAPLTRTERQIANLIIQRKTSKEIGEILAISPKTVDTHRNNIRKKLGIRNESKSLRTHLLASH